MKKKSLIYFSVGIISIFLLWSCEGYMDQFKMDNLSTEVEISPAFAAPIGYGEFSIDDIVGNLLDSVDQIQLENDSTMFVYFEAPSQSLNDFFPLLDQIPTIPDNTGTAIIVKSDLDVDLPGGIDLVPQGTEMEFSKQDKLEFNLNPEDRIDSVYMSAGNLAIEIFSEFKHPGELRMSTNGLVDPDGDSLNIVLPFSSADGTYTHTENVDLTGYKLTMNAEGDKANITINFTLKMIKGPAGISTTEEAGMNVNFTGIKFNAIFGRISRMEIDMPSQSIPLNIFNSVNVESLPTFYFADPQINMTFHNSIGLPLSFDLDLSSRSAIDGTEFTLELVDDYKPFIVQAPTVDQLGETVTSELSLNVQTSNVDEFLSNIPDLIGFGANVAVGNPDGYDEQNFILDTSNISFEANVKLPFHFRTSGYTLQDTLDVDLEEALSNITQIDSLIFGMVTTNEWPFELGVQIYFMDENYNIKGSLFDSYTPLLEAAPVTSEGDLDNTRLAENPVEIRLLEEDFDVLEGAKYIMFEARVITTDEGATPVKLKSNYKLKYKFYLAAGVTLRTSDFGNQEEDNL